MAGEISLPGMDQVIALMGEGGILKVPLPPAERFERMLECHCAQPDFGASLLILKR
jgi:hypothetical protein